MPAMREKQASDRWPQASAPVAQVQLHLDEPLPEGEEPVSHDISAVAQQGRTLFLSADECAHVEVLDEAEDGRWTGHRRIGLCELFELPDKADEMDIEGLAVDGGWLWVVGSHSRTRRKPKKHETLDAKAVERLAKLKDNLNRFFLGRLPLVELDGGRYGIGGLDRDDPEGRRPGMLPIGKRGGPLGHRLRDDPHLAPFMSIPAKENGLDIEGIVADGERVAVGLRGPVINGWACVLELRLHARKSGELKLEGGLVKRWLDLDGLGVRDMKRDGADVLILAGPTMALDGPVVVYRWRDWAGQAPPNGEASQLAQPERLMDLPFGHRCDHPEAIATWTFEDAPALLTVCDSPSPTRLSEGAIRADIFRMPSSAA